MSALCWIAACGFCGLSHYDGSTPAREQRAAPGRKYECNGGSLAKQAPHRAPLLTNQAWRMHRHFHCRVLWVLCSSLVCKVKPNLQLESHSRGGCDSVFHVSAMTSSRTAGHKTGSCGTRAAAWDSSTVPAPPFVTMVSQEPTAVQYVVHTVELCTVPWYIP